MRNVASYKRNHKWPNKNFAWSQGCSPKKWGDASMGDAWNGNWTRV